MIELYGIFFYNCMGFSYESFGYLKDSRIGMYFERYLYIYVICEQSIC